MFSLADTNTKRDTTRIINLAQVLIVTKLLSNGCCLADGFYHLFLTYSLTAFKVCVVIHLLNCCSLVYLSRCDKTKSSNQMIRLKQFYLTRQHMLAAGTL